MKVSHCPNCGKELSDEGLFCPFCGYDLSALQTPDVTSSKKVDQSLSQDEWGVSESFDAQLQKKKQKDNRFQGGEVLLSLRKYAEALKYYESLIAEFPLDPRGYVGRIGALSKGFRENYSNLLLDLKDLSDTFHCNNPEEKFPSLLPLYKIVKKEESLKKEAARKEAALLKQNILPGMELTLGKNFIGGEALTWRVLETCGNDVRLISLSPIAYTDTSSLSFGESGLKKFEKRLPSLFGGIFSDDEKKKLKGISGPLLSLPKVSEIERFFLTRTERRFSDCSKPILTADYPYYFEHGWLMRGNMSSSQCGLVLVLTMNRKEALHLFDFSKPLPKSKKEGGRILFGSLEGIPLYWCLLKKEGDFAYYISETPVFLPKEAKPALEWKDDPIKKFLNEDFFEKAFSLEEKERLASVDEENCKVSLLEHTDIQYFKKELRSLDCPYFNFTSKGLAITKGAQAGEELSYEKADSEISIFTVTSISAGNGIYPLIRMTLKEGIKDKKEHTYEGESSPRFVAVKEYLAETKPSFDKALRMHVSENGEFAYLKYEEEGDGVVVTGLDELFQDQMGLKLGFSKNVKAIKEGAFKHLDNIKKVSFSDSGLRSIPADLFDGCKNLKEVILPKKLERIEKNAFRGTALVSINVPSTVSEINDGAFASTKLTSFKIPSHLKTVTPRAFENDMDLHEIKGSSESYFTYDGMLFLGTKTMKSDIKGLFFRKRKIERAPKATLVLCPHRKGTHTPYLRDNLPFLVEGEEKDSFLDDGEYANFLMKDLF